MSALLIALYVGPDQVMPVMSILATIMGFLLVFWNKVLGIFRRILGMKPRSAPSPSSGTDRSATSHEPPQQP